MFFENMFVFLNRTINRKGKKGVYLMGHGPTNSPLVQRGV
jgi:hypothetical protein